MPIDPSKIRARLTSEKQWYRIDNLAGDEADVMLYGEIGWLGNDAEEFVREIKQLRSTQINLHLSSPGGSVFDGIAIMNGLRSHPANVTIYIDSLAASIASVIAMAGDKVVMRSASELMIHEAAGLSLGNADDMREMAELLDRQSNKIAAIYAERAGGTVEDWRAAMKVETWYSAEEAVAAGLADEVMPPRRNPAEEPAAEPRATWDLTVFRYAGREEAPAPAPAAKSAMPVVGEAGQCILPAATATPQPAESVQSEALRIDIGTALGEQLVAVLRAAVTETPTAVPPAAADDPAAEPAADPAPEAAAQPDVPPVPDGWADQTAHLTTPPADDWAALVAPLTNPPSPALSSSAATA
ncbi:Clp protease ClpP [Streptomyces sp. N2-109]|uniref:ATP-dependent Clp protease proteolytic subunit n=1 Tax=Streptomyces gossypii TaxID=2883101 RepID=A0ABT2JTF7_9ACTN|nr:head maturation protease, ClpP-related [Streptomyces gossypii]MCT2591143.1 Clp protease ClpP [Streptomyces gossypii]